MAIAMRLLCLRTLAIKMDSNAVLYVSLHICEELHVHYRDDEDPVRMDTVDLRVHSKSCYEERRFYTIENTRRDQYRAT